MVTWRVHKEKKKQRKKQNGVSRKKKTKRISPQTKCWNMRKKKPKEKCFQQRRTPKENPSPWRRTQRNNKNIAWDYLGKHTRQNREKKRGAEKKSND